MGTNSSLLNSKNGEKMSHQIEKNNIEGTHIPYNSLREYGYDFKSKIIWEKKIFKFRIILNRWKISIN